MNYDKINITAGQLLEIAKLFNPPLVSQGISFGRYFNEIEKTLDGVQNYYSITIPYVFDTKQFILKYKESIVDWKQLYREQGGVVMLYNFLLQLNKNTHFYGEVGFFADYQKESHNHIAGVLYYKNSQDFINFVEENLPIIKTGDLSGPPQKTGFF